jgi:hypothetical protein
MLTGLGLRPLGWYASRAASWVLRPATARVAAVALAVVATAFAVYATTSGIDVNIPWRESDLKLDSTGGRALVWGLYAALALAIFTARARRRLVLTQFVWLPSAFADAPPAGAAERSGGAEQDVDEGTSAITAAESPAAPLNRLVAAALGRISEAHRQDPSQRLLPTVTKTTTPLLATPTPDELDEFLRSSDVGGLTIKAGPVELPGGVIARAIRALNPAPVLSGSLHSTDTHWVLVASLSGRGARRAWEVRATRDATPSLRSALEALAWELALRIHVDLGLDGRVSWEAYSCFLKGLDLYRQSTLTHGEQGRPLLFLAAEAFIEALQHDATFDLAAYNLGVVYAELEREGAASRAFERAVESNARHWQALFGLAQIELRRVERDLLASPATLPQQVKRLDYVEAITNQVDALGPPAAYRARSRLVRAQARALRREPWASWRSYVRAASAAMRELRRAEALRRWTGDEPRRAASRELMAVCLREQAQLLLDHASRWPLACLRAERALLLATRMAPGDHELYSLLRRTYALEAEARPRLSRWAAQRARAARPGEATALADLASAYSQEGRKDETCATVGLALATLPLTTAEAPQALDALYEACLDVGLYDQAGQVAVLRQLLGLTQSDSEDRARFAAPPGAPAWEVGERRLAEAAWHLRYGRIAAAAPLLAAPGGSDGVPEEEAWLRRIRAWGLVEALGEGGKAGGPTAIREHLRLGNQDPLNTQLYLLAGAIAVGLEDSHTATRMLSRAVRLGPENYRAHWSLAYSAWQAAYGWRHPLRAIAFIGALPADDENGRAARRCLEAAAEAALPTGPEDPRWTEKTADRPWILYWLGVICLELGDSPSAQDSLVTAARLMPAGDERRWARLALAESLARRRRWDAALAEHRAVLGAVEHSDATTTKSSYAADLDRALIETWARRGQGLALLALGRHAEAEAALERARSSAGRIRDEELRRWWVAGCALALARLNLERPYANPAAAFDLLRPAVRAVADPEVFLAMAQATASLADDRALPDAEEGTLAWLRRSADADPAGEFADARDALSARLRR